MIRRVYVIGSYIPNGGTYIAHSLGELVHELLGSEMLSVGVTDDPATREFFPYHHLPPIISLEQMINDASSNDLIIVNPSFSYLGLGLRTPARTLIYAQGFSTFDVLDLFCTHYVSVSTFVSSFIKAVYGIETPIIPAFIDLPSNTVSDWHNRPDDLVLYLSKSNSPLTTEVENIILTRLRQEYPSIRFEPLTNEKVSRSVIYDRLEGTRYLLILSIAEGLGLIPLEAMAHGTTVIGFDGFGGREYMRTGKNCIVSPYPQIEELINNFAIAISNDNLSYNIGKNGITTARKYTRNFFNARWVNYINKNIIL